MALTKFLLPALSVAATAYAQCSTSATTTISNPAGASALASCSQYSGNILIQSGAADGGKLDLSGIQKINGDLTYENDNGVQTISAPQLSSITGALTLSNMSALSTIGLGGLESVGDITMSGLSVLGTLGFGSPGVTKAGTFTLINTQVNDLSGINKVEQIVGISISDNPLLAEISMAIDSISTIDIGPNDVTNGGVSVDFPNLTTADIVVIRNSTSVEVPSLENVSNDLALIGNMFSNFSAPNLTWAGGLVINDNTELTGFSFPLLITINGTNSTLLIGNNTQLTNISGLNELKSVKGDVTFSGNFSAIALPAITRIGGALTIDTASSSFDCSKFTGLQAKQVVAGKDSCRTGDKTKIGGSGSGTETGSGSAATSSSFGSPMEIPASFMSGFSILAGLLFL